MSIPSPVKKALSRLCIKGYWDADARPIGEFWSGCTAEESEALNWKYYGKTRVDAAIAELTKEPQ